VRCEEHESERMSQKDEEEGRDDFPSRGASFSDFPWDVTAALAALIHREAVGISRGWMRERDGYTRNARVLAKHDLFYRSSRAASIIPGRSAGSYLPPARRARHGGVDGGSPTGDQQVQDSAGCRDRR